MGHAASLSIRPQLTVAGATLAIPLEFRAEGEQIGALQFDLTWDEPALSVATAPGTGIRAVHKRLFRADASTAATRHLIAAIGKEPIPDQDALLIVFVFVDPKAAAGVYSVSLKNIVVSTLDAQPAVVRDTTTQITVQGGGPAPVIVNQGILNFASQEALGVAPGQLITILGPGTAFGAAADLSATFDGIPVPVLYAGPHRLDVLAPESLSDGSFTRFQFWVEGLPVASADCRVGATQPGLFTWDGSGLGPALVLNDDSTPNSASDPAAPGSIIRLYGTGFGLFLAPFAASVGGMDAEVIYAGLASGDHSGVGVVLVRVPPESPSDAQALVLLTVGQASSAAGVTVAIR